MKNQYYDFIYEKVGESASHLLGVRQTLYLIREALLYDQAGVIATVSQATICGTLGPGWTSITE